MIEQMQWRGSGWWVDPKLWDDEAAVGVERPTEDTAIQRVCRQAARRRNILLRVIVALEGWYLEHHPGLITFVRIHLIARRLDMTPYQVGDALREAEVLMDADIL